MKDVRLILQAAVDAGISLPLTETHRALMERAEAAGLGDLDNSAIIEVLRLTTQTQHCPNEKTR
jgi:3-hydroxyisobutyrate dehydrogenase-like beta-hydroxyacid dehydrogenase